MSIVKKFSTSTNTCKVTFSYPVSPEVNSVKILGDFNDWDSSKATEMKASAKEFSAVIDLNVGQSYEFRYLINNNSWDNDFNADKYVTSPFAGISNSVIVLEGKTTTPSKAKTTTKAAPKATTGKTVAKAATKSVATKTTATKASAPIKVADKPVAVKKVAAPKKATPAVKVAADDLTKIEGIGPKIALILKGKGVSTFDALSKSKATDIKKYLDEAGPKFTMHQPTTWPAQAKLAANGDWTSLTKLQDELKGGKKA